MTNNTTAPALTDEQRSRVEYALDYMGGSGFAPEADILRALLTSPRAAVPGQGWKLVPEIPTVEMLDAALPGDDTFGRGFKTRIYQEMLDATPAAPVAPAAEADPIDKLEPTLILTGAQLLEALDLVAPDRTADQFESEVSFQYGNGHSGKGMYCWITDYPDEGASLLDGSTVAAQAVAADGASTQRCNLGVGCDEAGVCYASAHGDASQCGRAAVSPAKDVVTREQVMEWARAANIGNVWFTDQIIAELRDFAILARAAVSPATAALPIKIPHVHIRPEDEEIGRQYYALGFVDGSRSITDAPRPAQGKALPATADSNCTCGMKLGHARHCAAFDESMVRYEPFGEKPSTADERAALQWTAGTLQEIVSGRWKGAKESDKVSIGSVTKTVAQILDMADAALGRASQAAAPAEARESSVVASGLIGLARHVRAVPAYSKLVGDMDIVDQAIAILNGAPAEAREPHSDDIAVDAFAAAMKAKMAASRAKGRGGWETCTPSDLSRMLREHVEKGDPRDVANFCMMLHHHGASISGAADAGEAADATRYRWLQRQRAKVWHEIADLPINHTNEYIDAAIAADGHSAQGGKGGEA
ncbi:rod-binding protein [Burkholderia gladioli]|uniref:rod-binding protein n=1 Tax=Burkholderia gladioli TaxID=28095 RepID=UPI0034DB7642